MRRIAFLLASIYCLTACNNEIIDGPIYDPDETNPGFELFMPDGEMVNVYSTATVSENTIDSMWVVVFSGSSPFARKWVEKIEGSQIVRNGDASQLLPQLKHRPAPGDSIICLANIDPVTDTASVSLSNINTYFKLSTKAYYTGTAHLPMSGGFKWSTTSGNVCVMTRAVAKIQIQMGTSVPDVTGDFSADNVTYQVYHYAAGGYIQPALPLSGIPNTAGTHTAEDFFLLQREGITQNESSVYLHECPSSNRTGIDATTPIGETVFNANRQFIILTKGTRTNARYYRLDFYNRATETFIDTKRNHHYIFTINKVRSEGYETELEAINNPGSNIEYDIVVEDGALEIISNGQYAIVATIDTLFGGMDGISYNLGAVRYKIPTGLAASPTTNSVSLQLVSSTPTATDALTLSNPSPAAMTASNQTVSVFVKLGTIDARAMLIFRLGNITYQKPIHFRAGS